MVKMSSAADRVDAALPYSRRLCISFARRNAGLRHVRGEAIEDSGHVVPTEQPERTAAALLQFVHECSDARGALMPDS